MTKREIYKKFTNLSKKELNTKNNKKTYVRNDVMTTIIKRCRGEKTRGIRAIDGFRKKIGKIFKKHNPLEEYSVKIYEIDPYFYEHYEKKIQADKNGCKYILFRIDIYFSECFLAVEIDEKRHSDSEIIFEKKDKKH